MNVELILSPTRWPIFGAIGSAGLLAGAFAFEHIGGLPPCPLCIEQRWAHVGVIVVGVISFALIQTNASARQSARLFNWILGLVFLFAMYKALNHVGIEYGWWAGPASCTASGAVSLDLNDLTRSLDQPTNVVLCDEIAWQMFGISMAGYNALISAGLAVLSFTAAFREKA